MRLLPLLFLIMTMAFATVAAQQDGECGNCSESTESVILRSFNSINLCEDVPECPMGVCPISADFVDDDSNIFVKVIVHVITTDSSLVIPATRVAGLLTAANGHFGGTIVDTTGLSMGPVDTNINFVPAFSNPEGDTLASPGLETHLVSPATFATIWDTNKSVAITNAYERFHYGPDFINMYVIDDSALYLDGDPTTASLSNRAGVGILLSSPHFLAVPGVNAAAFGATVAHELGHYLGLNHVWSVSCCSPTASETCDCLENGDLVCDTQEVMGVGLTPCTGSLGSVASNIMTYSTTREGFTQGQKTRMRYFL